jgi:hypothetical protein
MGIGGAMILDSALTVAETFSDALAGMGSQEQAQRSFLCQSSHAIP